MSRFVEIKFYCHESSWTLTPLRGGLEQGY
jgi:hypothetical protein